MRLKLGSSVRIVLLDGTAMEGIVRFSWRFRTVKLTDVVSQTRGGEIQADGYMLIPAHAVLLVQVGS